MPPQAIDLCPWLCRAPQQPGTPFAWPVLTVIDVFRVYIAVAAAILIVLSVWSIHRSGASGQKSRFAYAAFMTVGALGTELEQIGMWPHYRFVIYLVGVTIGLWAYYRHLFCEVPARDRPHRNERSP